MNYLHVFMGDLSPTSFITLSSLCFLSAFVDAIAGGGGLISLPAFMSVGIPPHIALGTNKVSASFSTIISAVKYAMADKVNWDIVKKTFIFSVIGAAIGVKTAISINPEYFKPISVVILILVFFYTIFNKNIGETNEYKGLTKKTILLGRILALTIGFYDGFLGPGTGSFLIFGMIKIFKLDFVNSNGNAKLLNVSSNIVSIILFIYYGKANIFLGISVAVIMAYGANIGSKMAIKRGSKFIKPVFLCVTSAVIIKMIYDILTKG